VIWLQISGCFFCRGERAKKIMQSGENSRPIKCTLFPAFSFFAFQTWFMLLRQLKSFDTAGIEKALLIPLSSCTLRGSISLYQTRTTAFVHTARLIITVYTILHMLWNWSNANRWRTRERIPHQGTLYRLLVVMLIDRSYLAPSFVSARYNTD